MRILLSFVLLMITSFSFSQCYNCNYDRSDQNRTRGPKRAFKKDFPDLKKVKWYSCSDIDYGVRDYSDSTITYIYSKEKEFLGKETRYYNLVTKYLTEFEYQQAEPEELENVETTRVKCLNPDVLPKAIWPEVAEIYQVEDLDTLNKVDGLPFWVCDMYKVEVPENHVLAKQEGKTTFYVVNMDFQFHIFSESEKLDHLSFLIEYHPQFYLELEELLTD